MLDTNVGSSSAVFEDRGAAAAPRQPAGHPEPSKAKPRPRLTVRRSLLKIAGFKLDLLDFGVALARKVGGFCALLTLGWLYFRQLVLGQSLHQIFPGAPDPDLRQTMWVALFLIMAMGWDIPLDEIAVYWSRLSARLPQRAARPSDTAANSEPQLVVRLLGSAWAAVEPVVTRLGCFMDLCVAIANKVGALAVLVTLAVLADEMGRQGMTLRQMYPDATDPTVSLLADVCVYVVVLGWWAMPFDQIQTFWHRLRELGLRNEDA